jgi:hypothetical protein
MLLLYPILKRSSLGKQMHPGVQAETTHALDSAARRVRHNDEILRPRQSACRPCQAHTHRSSLYAATLTAQASICFRTYQLTRATNRKQVVHGNNPTLVKQSSLPNCLLFLAESNLTNCVGMEPPDTLPVKRRRHRRARMRL